jgi:hypothetical protein
VADNDNVSTGGGPPPSNPVVVPGPIKTTTVQGGQPPTGTPLPTPSGGLKPTPTTNPIQGGKPPTGTPIPTPTGGLSNPVARTPAPAPVSTLDQMINSLSGSNRDAFVALETLFNSYGLGTLVNSIFNFIQQGYSQDTITLLLQQTPEYQQRFAGNAARQKNGLAILSPADYLATEASYYQIVQAAGLPANFYNSTSDWVNWIGNDVSPAEVQSRVQMAQTATEQAPPDLVQALGQMGVPQSSLVSYFLDDSKALPIITQQFNAAQIGAAALRNNLVMDPARATTFANMGITVDQANSAYQQIGETLPTLEELGRVYNQNYTQQTAENNLIMGQGQAAFETSQLESQERGAFSGNVGAAGQGALARSTPVGSF